MLTSFKIDTNCKIHEKSKHSEQWVPLRHLAYRNTFPDTIGFLKTAKSVHSTPSNNRSFDARDKGFGFNFYVKVDDCEFIT